MYDSDRELLEEYQATKEWVEEETEEVAAEEEELLYLEQTLEEQQAELEVKLAQMKSQMDDYEDQLAKAEELAAQYRSTITEMDSVIAAAQAAAAATATTSNRGGGSSSAYTAPTGVSYSGKGGQVASYACQFVGNPYVYGGTSLTNGCDCSGFVMSVYAHFGVSLPHSSSAMRSVGVAVSVSEMMPGDIVCYSGHVGIYVGSGTIVNASSPSRGICYTNAYYRSILAVRRIFT